MRTRLFVFVMFLVASVRPAPVQLPGAAMLRERLHDCDCPAELISWTAETLADRYVQPSTLILAIRVNVLWYVRNRGLFAQAPNAGRALVEQMARRLLPSDDVETLRATGAFDQWPTPTMYAQQN